jgi:hypothetical protein
VLLLASEGERAAQAAESVDDAVAGDVRGVGIDVQRPADPARRSGPASQRGDVAVCRDLASGYAFYDLVYRIIITQLRCPPHLSAASVGGYCITNRR